jgi:hypothetical protein
MGLSNWIARKGNIGGTARAVAKGWKTIKEKDPAMNPRDIAKTYVNFRYTLTGETHLAEEVLLQLPYDVNPLILSWTILKVENKDEIQSLYDHKQVWKQIMREEIEKLGVEPE